MENFEINTELVRKSNSRDVFLIKEKRVFNKIVHYILKSRKSQEIILSEIAVKKEFCPKKSFRKKDSFIASFRKRISGI